MPDEIRPDEVGPDEIGLDDIGPDDTPRPRVGPRVGIVMGSDSDWPVMGAAGLALREFDVPFEADVVSAHRMPDAMITYGRAAHTRGLEVIIAGAGGAAHLPGMIASATPLPEDSWPPRASRAAFAPPPTRRRKALQLPRERSSSLPALLWLRTCRSRTSRSTRRRSGSSRSSSWGPMTSPR